MQAVLSGNQLFLLQLERVNLPLIFLMESFCVFMQSEIKNSTTLFLFFLHY